MRKLALLVGIEEYCDRQITPLQFAKADVLALSEQLYGRCGFERVEMLVDSGGAKAPDLGNFLDALRDLAGDLRPEDFFLFFFAGHGIEVDGHGYLLMRDSRQAFPQHTSLSLDLLGETFGSLVAGRRAILLDACRNDPRHGKGDAGNRMGKVISRDIAAVAQSRVGTDASMTTAMLAACRAGQRAYEWPTKGHGVFAHFLLQGLSGAAWQGGVLDFRSLARYTAQEVKQWSAKTLGVHEPQIPWYEEFGDPEPLILGGGARMESSSGELTRELEAEADLARITEMIRENRVSPDRQIHLWQTFIKRHKASAAAMQAQALIHQIQKEGRIHIPGDDENEYIKNSIGMKLKAIQPGAFTMGSRIESDQNPVQHVTIHQPFWIGIYPVTQREYEAVMKWNPARCPGDDRPVECVAWEDAIAYCERLSDMEGVRYRLPTEAEWEYACRAGSQSDYFYGDDERRLSEFAWYKANSKDTTQPVGQKKPNAWGLYDMLGNVWEWCQDPHAAEFDSDWISLDARVLGNSQCRILRGGACNMDAISCHSASRAWAPQNLPGDPVGFRVARDPK